MLTDKEVLEIKEHLEKAANPLFFFDNDVDGLSAFLILQRYIGRGRGVVLKSMEVAKRRIDELKPDYIFVLDKARIEDEFLEMVKEAGVPAVYIDHHAVPKMEVENYYNTYHSSGESEPTSYLCYKIAGGKEDEWLAVLGGIADSYLPDFIADFKQRNPDLIDYDYKTAYDIRYNTVIGKISQVLNYGLKDSTTNVVAMLKFLMKARGPMDVLEENGKTETFLRKYNELNSLSEGVIAKASPEGDLVFLTYGGKMSLSQDIADKLMYKYPDKLIAVGYLKTNVVKFSLRGKGIKTLTEKAVSEIEGATGGGHEFATGIQIREDQVEKLKEILKKG